MLFQPSQGTGAGTLDSVAVNVQAAIPVDATGPPQLDTDDDEADGPQDEEDEGAHDDDAGQQLALGNQPQHDDDEDDGERADGDPVGEVPGEGVSLVVSYAHTHT